LKGEIQMIEIAGLQNRAGYVETQADTGQRMIAAMKALIHQDVRGRPGCKFSDYIRIIGEFRHGLLLSCFGLPIAFRIQPELRENGSRGEIHAFLLDHENARAGTDLLTGWRFDDQGTVYRDSAMGLQLKWRVDEAVIVCFETMVAAVAENSRVLSFRA
jgi:hypothetical protein